MDAELLERHRAVVAVDARYILESRTGVTLGEVVAQAMDQYNLEGFPLKSGNSITRAVSPVMLDGRYSALPIHNTANSSARC